MQPGDKKEILEADSAFSALSKKEGMSAAFIQFMDNDGVLLRPGKMPMAGAEAIQYLSALEDKDFVLTWQPKAAEISANNDIGYSYGTYTMQPSQIDTILVGTYINVWKKQADGSWLYSINSWNEGLSDTTLQLP